MNEQILTDEQCDVIWNRALEGIPPIDIHKAETFRRIIREAYAQGDLDASIEYVDMGDDE